MGTLTASHSPRHYQSELRGDANDIADKGYVNQAVTRARRAHLVQALFHAEPAAHVARAVIHPRHLTLTFT